MDRQSIRIEDELNIVCDMCNGTGSWYFWEIEFKESTLKWSFSGDCRKEFECNKCKGTGKIEWIDRLFK